MEDNNKKIIFQLKEAIKTLEEKKHKKIHCVAVICQYQQKEDDYRVDIHFT